MAARRPGRRAASRTAEVDGKKYVSELEVPKEGAPGSTLHKEKEVEAAENIESGLEMMKKSRADELEKATVAEKSKPRVSGRRRRRALRRAR